MKPVQSIRRGILFACAVVSLAPAAGGAQRATTARSEGSLLQRILAAEDARGAGGIATILEGIRSDVARLRLVSVRALGRLEVSSVGPAIVPFLDDKLPAMRMEAASALAQSVQALPRGADAPDSARKAVQAVQRALSARLETEEDRAVGGVLARSLGRLPYFDSATVRSVEKSILARAGRPDVAVMQGLYALARSRRAAGGLTSYTVALIRNTARTGKDVNARRAAMLAYGAVGNIDSVTVRIASRDPDPQVRRLAFAGISSLTTATAEALVRRALRDTSAMVRFDAVRAVRRNTAGPDCSLLVAATRDKSPGVVLAAIDAIGAPGPASAASASGASGASGTGSNSKPCVQSTVAGVLLSFVRSLPASDVPRVKGRVSWHAAAHAIVALARIDSSSARAELPRFAAHPRAEVRSYAARAAQLLRDRAVLFRLVADTNRNVQEAAIAALDSVAGHDADSTYVRALSSSGYQVVRAAAVALLGSSDARAPAALMDALDRITGERRETSRDPRLAIMVALSGMSSPASTDRLAPYTADFDTTVAQKAAELLSKSGGSLVLAKPVPLPIRAEPLEAMSNSSGLRLRFTMAASSGGGAFVVKLFPGETPATVARVVRLARAHYYDGLTFHRVVPNFVIQGGSPGGSEWVGDAAFMRDEFGLRSHRRGTLGVSTGGRDTGDGQLYLNLVDNYGLDFHYTVFGEIASGLPVADGVLEGDVIAKVEVLTGK